MDSNQKKCRFCSACGAPLTETPFCGQCGAKVVVTAVHIPEPQEEATPVETVTPAEEIAEPVAETAPVTETAPEVEIIPNPEPVVPVKPRARKFPVAAVILMGIVALWMVIQLLFVQVSWTSAVHACCTTAILVGMIVCKKERNLIVGFAFLAYACLQTIVYCINMNDQFKADPDVTTVLMGLVIGAIYVVWYGAFGASYLVAKPKIAILKNIMGGILTGFGLLGVIAMGITLILFGNGTSSATAFLQYLLYFTPMGLSVILYTPFRRR